MSLLYVTSFSKKLYEYSGKKLIESYLKYDIKDPILICTEDFEYESDNPRIMTSYIGDDEYLTKWLTDNEDIIPIDRGGKSEISYNALVNEMNKYCILYNPSKRIEYLHKTMNYRTKDFFMKMVSLKRALDEYGSKYDYIIWIDCDCVFKGQLLSYYVISMFDEKYGMFYHQGRARNKIDNGYETGFTGYSKKHGGYEIMKRIFECYGNGDFRKYVGWYDGYITRMISESSKDILQIDLVSNSIISNVMEIDSPLKNYIKHNKGIHTKKGIIKYK